MRRTFGNGSLVSAAMILAVSSLASRLVGLLRERALTTTFGAGPEFDAFVAAFRIPDLIFNLIVVGSLSAAFIPLFTDKLVKDSRQAAFDFALATLNMVTVVVISLSLALALFAPWLMPLIVPGFTGDQLRVTITLSQIMAWQPILLAVSFILSGVLNSFKRFVVYAVAPILYNVGIIIGVVAFVPFMGVAGVGWGVVLGAALHMLIQLPSVLAVGFRWRPQMPWAPGDARKLWRLMLPRAVGLAATQVNLLIVTIIGSSLAAGSIAVFHLANNIQALPVGIFGIAFAQAAFPTLAEHVAHGRQRMLVTTLSRTFRYIMFFIVPISLFFFLLRAQIVRVLFGAGAFDWEDTILTFETFGWLIMSIFAQATIPLLARAFYVQQDTKTPVGISIISMLLNIVLAWGLAPRMGVQGLALAFSLAALVHVFLLLGFLHWRLGGFDDRRVLVSLLRMVVAAIVAGIAVQLLKYPVASVVNMQRLWGVLTQLVVAGGGGVATYLGIAWLLKSEELKALRKYMPRQATLELPSGTETSRFDGLIE